MELSNNIVRKIVVQISNGQKSVYIIFVLIYIFCYLMIFLYWIQGFHRERGSIKRGEKDNFRVTFRLKFLDSCFILSLFFGF